MLKVQQVKQTKEMVRKLGRTRNFSVPKSRQNKRKLTNQQAVALAQLAVKLQQHYEHPQDIEWAIEDKEIFIVQTRPITTIQNVANRQVATEQMDGLLKKMPLILQGEPASPGIVSNKVKHIHSPSEIHKLEVGEIMVTSMTTPDFVPAMKKAGGLIMVKGDKLLTPPLCHGSLGCPV